MVVFQELLLLHICILAAVMIGLKVFFLETLLPLNALVTIILCRLVLQYMQKKQFLENYHPLVFFIFSLLFLIPTTVFSEYGSQALLYAAMGYMVKHNLNQGRYQLFFALTFSLFVFIQIIGFHFDDAQSMFVLTGTALVTWLLANYRIKEFPMSQRGVSNVIKFFSRYSLYYYTAHVTILQIIWARLNPEIFAAGHFRIIQ